MWCKQRTMDELLRNTWGTDPWDHVLCLESIIRFAGSFLVRWRSFRGDDVHSDKYRSLFHGPFLSSRSGLGRFWREYWDLHLILIKLSCQFFDAAQTLSIVVADNWRDVIIGDEEQRKKEQRLCLDWIQLEMPLVFVFNCHSKPNHFSPLCRRCNSGVNEW